MVETRFIKNPKNINYKPTLPKKPSKQFSLSTKRDKLKS